MHICIQTDRSIEELCKKDQKHQVNLLTDEVAKDFKEDVEVTTTEKYNDVAKFLYSKVPVGAPAKLRKELGKEVADKKVHRDFLMEGLKIETLGIIFEDKSELTLQNEDWEYLTK